MSGFIDLKSEAGKVSKAFLVGRRRDAESAEYALGLLDELRELVVNIGFEIAGEELVYLREPNPHYLIGSGKFNEIKGMAEELGCDCIIFDDAISPAQQRNWEKETGKCVIDRQEVILEIFSRRAQTKEACLQIELARLEYSLPRLKRAWTHLSRQRGGGVTQRGAGESQLETDRRYVTDRIARLKREIVEVKRVRDVGRKRRQDGDIPSIAIVGYTNAGKSSLMNKLSNAGVVAENKLFATLDPTTRRVRLPDGAEILLTDTVGFVRRLPHSFVEAFKSTLEEAACADILIHLVDASSHDAEEHVKTTREVLKELGAADKPRITVFNKMDKASENVDFYGLKTMCSGAIDFSVRTGQGMDELLERIRALVSERAKMMDVLLPHSQYKLLNLLQSIGAIRSQAFEDDGVYISACIPNRLVPLFENWQTLLPGSGVTAKKCDQTGMFNT